MIVGVDPGSLGAAAAVNARGEIIFIEDMPVLEVRRGKSDKLEIDGYALAELFIERVKPGAIVFVELVNGMQGQSASAAFAFGRSAAAPEYIAKARGMRVERVAPATWKRGMGLLAAGKDGARAMASRMWPQHAGLFKRVKDDGRAEAALLAEWGRRRLRAEGGIAQKDMADVFA